MKVEMLVMEEGWRTFKSKGVEQREYVFTGRDVNANKEEGRCANNLVYMPVQEDMDKYMGKLQDQRVTIYVREISVAFNGDVRLKGRIQPIGNGASK